MMVPLWVHGPLYFPVASLCISWANDGLHPGVSFIVTLPFLMSPYAVLLSQLIFPHLFLVLGWLLQLESWPRMRNISQL